MNEEDGKSPWDMVLASGVVILKHGFFSYSINKTMIVLLAKEDNKQKKKRLNKGGLSQKRNQFRQRDILEMRIAAYQASVGFKTLEMSS